MNITKSLIICSLLFMVNSAYSQFGISGSVNARSMAMAKVYTATSNGVYSIGLNPSRLSLKNDGEIDFTSVLPVPSVSFRGGTDFLTLQEFNYFFGSVDGKPRLLTEEDKLRFNDLFKDGGFVFANAGINYLAISYKVNPQAGAFAFSMQDYIGGKFVFPQAIVDVALTGNPNGKIYDLGDTNLKSWWIRNYSASYARAFNEMGEPLFDELNCGISFKLVQGFAYIGTEEFNSTAQTQDENTIYVNSNVMAHSAFSDKLGLSYTFESIERQQNISPFIDPAGAGFGIDFGLSAKIDNWNFGFAITDIGSINWYKNTAEFSYQGKVYFDDLANDPELDTLKNAIIGSAKPSGNFSTPLATALRLGASYRIKEDKNFLPGTLLLAADFNQGFNDMPGNSLTPRISIGAEWKPGNWIPYIRTGLGFGGNDGFNWAFGFGFNINFVELHISSSSVQSVIAPNTSGRVSFGIGSRWKF